MNYKYFFRRKSLFKFKVTTSLFKYTLNFIIFIFILLNFFGFRKFDRNDSQKVNKNIETLLRNETNISNFYAISKTLVDLESLEVFKCAFLREENKPRNIYYNSIETKCRSSIFSNLRTQNIILKALNGNKYELKYIKNIDAFAIITELLIYLILVSISLVFQKYLKNLEYDNNLKIKALEVEKNMMLDHNKQIKHDVASPISALNSIVSLLKNIDPEIKSVLISAIKRTEMIFEDLNLSPGEPVMLSLKPIIQEIVNEKKILWSNTVNFELESFLIGDDIYILSEEKILKRIISNIFNNSYEAYFFNQISRDNKIKNSLIISIGIEVNLKNKICSVKICDNGPGIPVSILKKVGQNGFSYGKENIQSAGAGLGIYNAKKSLLNWGGDFEITNCETNGALVRCDFKMHSLVC